MQRKSSVSEVSSWTSYRRRSNHVASANFSSNHLFLLPSLRVYLHTLLRSVPFLSPNSALKSHPMIGMSFWQCADCFVDRLNVVVRIFWAEKVNTHQFDVLSVHQDRGGDGTFVDVLNVDVSCPAPFVQHNSDSVFVVEFSTSHQRKQTNHKIRWDISGRNGRAPSRVLLSPMSIMLSRTRKNMALWWCTVYNVS